MPFDFEDSEISSTSCDSGSDGGENHTGDDEKADYGRGVRRDAMKADGADDVMVSTESLIGKKRAFVEDGGEVVDLRDHDQFRMVEEVRARPVKRVRRSAV